MNGAGTNSGQLNASLYLTASLTGNCRRFQWKGNYDDDDDNDDGSGNGGGGDCGHPYDDDGDDATALDLHFYPT